MAHIRGRLLDGNDSSRIESRTWLEAAGWIALVTLLWGADLFARIAEREQSGFGKDDFRLVSEQVTSGIAVLVMVLFVIRWLRLFPLRRDVWVPAVIGHTAGSVLFAFGHHALMIVLRVPWYSVNGREYGWREPFLPNLIVEYQKDIKVYFGIVVLLAAYGLYRRSRQEISAAPIDRIVVQTGVADRVLSVASIEFLEAARNYVSVHAEGREFVVRDSISNLVRVLPGTRFARTHRSYIVNLDKVREIRTADSQHCVVLTSGRLIPLSRGYRDAFRSLISGLPHGSSRAPRG